MFGGQIKTHNGRRFFDLENIHGKYDGNGICVMDVLSSAKLSSLYDIFEPLVHDVHPDWRIHLSDLTDYAYDMDVDDKILTLNSHGLGEDKAMQSQFFAPQIILSLIEGLRMVRHVELLDGALECYDIHTVIHIGRICMADCVSQTIKTAWLAKCDGYDHAWKHLICGDFGGLAHKFSSVMETFLSSGMDNDMALEQSMAIMFNDWFTLDDKVFQCDHDSLNMMDDMVNDDIEFGSKPLKTITIACLSAQSGTQTSYLQKPYVDDVLNNPYYFDVNNTINRIHLSQLTKDIQSTCVNGIQFRDCALAERFLHIDADITL